ncbi:MAG: hypothetical protein FWF84_07430, partial [Kiritimatiellaeota bacterium]|nr:hypothetical protein [Kiritimatiellota bacterium]
CRVWAYPSGGTLQNTAFLTLKVAPSATTPENEWKTIPLFFPEPGDRDDVSCIVNNTTYARVRITLNDMDCTVLRIYGSTNASARVAIDNVLVTEPLVSALDILSVTLNPGVPLVYSNTTVNVKLGYPAGDPQNIRVFIDYYIDNDNGTNVWGVAQWTQTNSVELVHTGPGAHDYGALVESQKIPTKGKDVDTVFQYRARITYEDGEDNNALRQSLWGSSTNHFRTPDYYEPIDLNAANNAVEAGTYTPYFYVFAVSTNAVYISEFLVAYSLSATTNEYVELMGPVGAPLAGWMLDVVDAEKSAVSDEVVFTHTLKPNAVMGHGTPEGWGFYVLGENDPLGHPVNSAPGVVDQIVVFDHYERVALYWNGGLRLRRAMGAYVDRVCYGAGWIVQAGGPMTERGYVYAGNRDTGDRTYYLDQGMGVWNRAEIYTPGGMNSTALGSALGANLWYTLYDGDENAWVKIAIDIANIRYALNQATITANVSIINEHENPKWGAGWDATVMATTNLTTSSWTSVATTNFTDAGEYIFEIDASAPSGFYYIEAMDNNAE